MKAAQFAAFVAFGLRGRRLGTHTYIIPMTSSPTLGALRLSAIPLACASLFYSHLAVAQVQLPTQPQTQPQAVLITATRQAQPVNEILLDHDIITAQEIALAGPISVAQLLQKRRGVEIASNGGVASASSVFLRGTATNQSLVLVDGVRVGSATTGGATYANIPLSQIDRIEIVYGPLSSLYGSDAIGGVIQIFTKQGSTFLEPTATVGFGGKGTRTQQAGISGSTGGERNVRFSLQAGHEEADGFSASKPPSGPFTFNPDRDGYSRNSANGQVSWKLSSAHELGASFLQSRLKNQFDAGLDFDDTSVERLENVSLNLKSQFLPNVKSHFQASRSSDKNDTDASFGIVQFNTVRHDYSFQNDISFGRDLLQVVLEHQKEEVGSNEVALQRSRQTNSQALSYQLRRNAHLASVSLRHDNNSQFGGRTTGSLGYGYRITRAWRVNGSFGTSFRAPAFNELFFPSFGVETNRPERGRNAEISTNYQAGDQNFSATYFRNRLSDLLVFTPVCPVQPETRPFGCAANINQALLRGLSLGASSKWQHWTLRGSLDFQDPHDETTDKRLARRSRKYGNVALEYASGPFTGSIESIFSGDRFDDAANSQPIAGYGLVNLAGSYQFAPNWSVFARFDNIGNKDYELAKNFNTPRRTGFIGVRFDGKPGVQ